MGNLTFTHKGGDPPPLNDPRSPSELSFEAVYRAHFDFVWRTLRRLGVSEADAPDAAQEVFLVVHRRLAEFEGRAKLTTWLFRMCFRVASDHSRRAHVRREVNNDAALEAFTDPGGDAEQRTAQQDDLRLLEAALSTMSLEHRTVFVLFELEGLTSVEIAELLELPLGTVYSRLRRARALFERAIKQRARPPSLSLAREGI
jgi:RNA polymerase sigma-70 factor (ECF subfamily)